MPDDRTPLPSEILEGAYNLLVPGHRQEGQHMVPINRWTKGVYMRGDKCCLIGAVHLSAYDGALISFANPDVDHAKRWARYYLQEAIAPGSEEEIDLEGWNDEPERTLDQVLGALVAAKLLALGEGR